MHNMTFQRHHRWYGNTGNIFTQQDIQQRICQPHNGCFMVGKRLKCSKVNFHPSSAYQTQRSKCNFTRGENKEFERKGDTEKWV